MAIVRCAPAVALVILLASCASPPPPEPPLLAPPASVSSWYFAGTPVSGPLPILPEIGTVEGSLTMSVTTFALERMPADLFDPLGEHARLVLSTLPDRPLLATPTLLAKGRCASADDAAAMVARVERGELGRGVLMSREITALPPAVTVSMRVDSWGLDITTVQRRLDLQLHRPESSAGDQKLELAVQMQELAGSVSEVVPKRELVCLDLAPVIDGAGVILLLPTTMEGYDTDSMAVVLNVTSEPPDDNARDQQRRQFSRCQFELERYAATPRPKLIAEPRVEWPSSGTAAQGLNAAQDQRTALVFLANVTDAPLTRDLATSADDEIVRKLAAMTLKDPELAAGRQRGPAMAWTLESSAFTMLLDMQAKEPLPSDLDAVLVRRAGQLARDRESLMGALKTCHDVAELDAELLRANLVCLEEPSPAARVRAFDWLSLRGQAPEGYDPLAPPRERRAALQKAANAREADAKAANAKEAKAPPASTEQGLKP